MTLKYLTANNISKLIYNPYQIRDSHYKLHCKTKLSTEIYEGISKSPRTMLITRKSLVVHEFPATVCCGSVL